MAAVNVSAVVSEIAAQALPVAAIGLAVLLLLVGIAAFQYLRAVLGVPEIITDPEGSNYYGDHDDGDPKASGYRGNL